MVLYIKSGIMWLLGESFIYRIWDQPTALEMLKILKYFRARVSRAELSTLRRNMKRSTAKVHTHQFVAGGRYKSLLTSKFTTLILTLFCVWRQWVFDWNFFKHLAVIKFKIQCFSGCRPNQINWINVVFLRLPRLFWVYFCPHFCSIPTYLPLSKECFGHTQRGGAWCWNNHFLSCNVYLRCILYYCIFLFFQVKSGFLTEFTPYKADQPMQSMKLQEKEFKGKKTCWKAD